MHIYTAGEVSGPAYVLLHGVHILLHGKHTSRACVPTSHAIDTKDDQILSLHSREQGIHICDPSLGRYESIHA